ncbi:MAG TPA: shikimate kinase [Porphyromonadaceae bacterium]|jgi:shikimate kinase|uniref:shikimate kinase n=1 Tax=Limibacterium fermenti TaxID=3229863 RepID=UPI000E9DD242|nr:shikimate kinase [Porphyromonadaceae bacterium]HBL32826.1 shikimate kinase [Porphyromonadaceae bacterium]HBX20607.1 shikimate kinase [Porphyromonadaceae bacterium]HBX44710.1 shikimate kinase [Porphyromonadaceae bacterium]HCM21341.1 shikimate kinase [Porphyromonadaceae bacterium]
MERIFIVGYMGVGKSTVGRGLAALMGLSFIDLDQFIQSKYHKSIPDLFKDNGEEGFRTIERKALIEVSEFEDVIVSTGGGAPCFYDNMTVMNNAGTTVYMKADVEELADRLQASKTVRPLIAGKTREELIPFISAHLSARERFYNEAKIIYYTDRLVTKQQVHITIDGIAQQIKNYRYVK